MSDFTLEFTLKQHTPLIHFQRDQAGATLRATEVKAKLDRFIISKLLITPSSNSLNQLLKDAVWKNWLIGGSQAKNPSFDYKIKISDIDSQTLKGTTPLISTHDVGKWIKSRQVRVCIFTYHNALKTVIESYYHEFFALANFGKRQSKGWGSFYPETDEDKFEDLLKASGKPIYKKFLNTKDNADIFYKTVIDVWRLLKSGKNSNNIYRKSMVFKYMAGKGFRWDKRCIKQDLDKLIKEKKLQYDLAGNKPPVDSQSHETGCSDDNNDCFNWNDNPTFTGEYRFVRAMLGLPEIYEFKTTDRGVSYQVGFANADVERFKSPVTFKIFNNVLYAIAEPMPPGIFNKKFFTTVKPKNNNKHQDVNPLNLPSVLTTPTLKEFNLVEFLDEYFPCVGLKRIK
jgi:hypothetical protein